MTGRKQQREQIAADALAALGNRSRLRIFKLLVRAGRDGTNIGTIQRMLGIPATTLGHHLGTLTKAGLVDQERRSREVICTANYKAVSDVLEYVREECCAGLEATQSSSDEAA
jgi:ArsR family transcriptional regulator, arsenate/arsenite/antimonite-responsive transcriptional repressor